MSPVPWDPHCGCRLPSCVANGSKWPCICASDSRKQAARILYQQFAKLDISLSPMQRARIEGKGMFAKRPVRPRRKLQLSRFDPGEHFYLRFPTGIMPAGDRATDKKYDTIDAARQAAAGMGYAINDQLLVVDSFGDTTYQALAPENTKPPSY